MIKYNKPISAPVLRPNMKHQLKEEILLQKPSASAKELLGEHKKLKTSYPREPWFPENLMVVIKDIIETDLPKTKKSKFKFDMSQDSANWSWEVLRKADFSLEKALNEEQHSQLGYGSEFRPVKILEPLLYCHPLWPRLVDQFKNGVSYPLEDLDDEERLKDLVEALQFGNHKGVDENEDLFEEMMNTDVIHGYSLVIPREKSRELIGALISPMNIVEQSTINEFGEIVPKKRLTHNQSMEFQSGTSVNSRAQKDLLQDVMYGSCLIRVIHQIVTYRFRYPNHRILMQKVDFKSAYRRSHLNAKTALQTITQFVKLNICFIALRLTFGGAPNPNYWSEISETVTDLTNALLQCKEWDPDVLHSPLQSKVPKTPESKDDHPFNKALPLIVNVAPSNMGQCDCYIDDLTTTVVDIGNNAKRAAAAVLLAIFILGRPLDPEDDLKRVDLVSLSKLQAEAALEEQKVLLGWKLDTRSLEISLPMDKFIAWTNNINDILDRKSTTFKELETLIGRLGHVTVVVQHAKHFMSRLRTLMKRASHRRKVPLPQDCKEDLEFHLQVLEKAKTGINMNMLTYRKVDIAYRSDACPAGIGGYSSHGRAWRFSIPKNLQFRATLNMLEFVASTIGVWIDIIEKRVNNLSCILSMTDSTTSAGWLKKSNFQENESESKEMTAAKLSIARCHALRLLENNIRDYSQWFPGVENEVADSLSRDFHISDANLTNLIFSSARSQTPSQFQISPLPQEIHLFLSSMLQTLPEATQQREKHKVSSLSLGKGGMSSSSQLKWTRTYSYNNFQKESEQSSSQLLLNLLDKAPTAEDLIVSWLRRQSEPPWTTFRRPSETTISPI